MISILSDDSFRCNAKPGIAVTSAFLESIVSQDSQLQQAILAELNWQPGVSAGHIGVTAKNGIVTLTGLA